MSHTGLRLVALPDDELMVLARAGDARAFETMVDRHADAAFSLAYRMCGARATAEDIVTDTFLSLWRTGARYDATRGGTRAWVLGSVRRRAIARFRADALHAGRKANADGAVRRLPAGGDARG